jgi:hypothetical protein
VRPELVTAIGVIAVVPYAACVMALVVSQSGGDYKTTIMNYLRKFDDHFNEFVAMTITIYFAHAMLCFVGL